MNVVNFFITLRGFTMYLEEKILRIYLLLGFFK